MSRAILAEWRLTAQQRVLRRQFIRQRGAEIDPSRTRAVIRGKSSAELGDLLAGAVARMWLSS